MAVPEGLPNGNGQEGEPKKNAPENAESPQETSGQKKTPEPQTQGPMKDKDEEETEPKKGVREARSFLSSLFEAIGLDFSQKTTPPAEEIITAVNKTLSAEGIDSGKARLDRYLDYIEKIREQAGSEAHTDPEIKKVLRSFREAANQELADMQETGEISQNEARSLRTKHPESLLYIAGGASERWENEANFADNDIKSILLETSTHVESNPDNISLEHLSDGFRKIARVYADIEQGDLDISAMPDPQQHRVRQQTNDSRRAEIERLYTNFRNIVFTRFHRAFEQHRIENNPALGYQAAGIDRTIGNYRDFRKEQSFREYFDEVNSADHQRRTGKPDGQRQRLYGLTPEEKLIVLHGSSRDRMKLFEELTKLPTFIPGREYSANLGFSAREKIESFFEALQYVEPDANRKYDRLPNVRALIEHYSTLFQIKELMHNANYIAVSGGEITDLQRYLRAFRGEFLDLIHNRKHILGVAEANQTFEEEVERLLAESGGDPVELAKKMQIDYRGEHESQLEKRVRERLKEKIAEGLVIDENGKPAELEDWELDRTIALSRGFNVVTLRFFEMAAKGRLPTGRLAAYASIYGNDIARNLDAFEHFIEKFRMGEKGALAILAQPKYLGELKAPGRRGKKLPLFYTPSQLEKLVYQLAPEEAVQRFVDTLNALKIGGPLTSSWRAVVVASNIPFEQRPFGLRLKTADAQAWDEMEVGYKQLFGKKMGENAWINEWKRLKDRKDTKDEHKKKVEGLEKETWRYVRDNLPMRMAWEDPQVRIVALADALGLTTQLNADVGVKQGDGKYDLKKAEAFLRQHANVDQLEKDLLLAQQKRLQKRNQYTTLEALLTQDQTFLVQAPDRTDRIDRCRKFVRYIHNEYDDSDPKNKKEGAKTFKDFIKKPRAFIVGMEDIQWNDIEFFQAGGTGFLARRMNDNVHEKEAVTETVNLINELNTFENEDQFLAQLHKIQMQMEGYDSDGGREYVTWLFRGILLYGTRDWKANVIEPVGAIVRFFGEETYAQRKLGPESFSFDETDKRRMLLKAWRMGILDKEKFDTLCEEYRCRLRDIWLQKVVRVGPAISIISIAMSAWDAWKNFTQRLAAALR